MDSPLISVVGDCLISIILNSIRLNQHYFNFNVNFIILTRNFTESTVFLNEFFGQIFRHFRDNFDWHTISSV